jgi:hypothetical protein
VFPAKNHLDLHGRFYSGKNGQSAFNLHEVYVFAHLGSHQEKMKKYVQRVKNLSLTVNEIVKYPETTNENRAFF